MTNSTEFYVKAPKERSLLLNELNEISQEDFDPETDWEVINAELESLIPDDEQAQRQQDELLEKIEDGDQMLATLSGIVAGMLHIDLHPFSYDGREYLQGLYDIYKDHPNGCRDQLWIAGRQVEKSTTQACKSVALGITIPAYRTLYVAPRFDQVTVFSQQRFKPICEDSPQLADRWVKPSRTLWQVGAKQFANGSFYNFRSCFLSADNSRGISAHHLMIDEIQDILSDNIPVLEQCQSHASRHERFNSYAGTPKTFSNVISRRWDNSCQFEWLIKCEHCKNYNYCGDEIVGEKFYECTRCHKEIYPINGSWVPARPDMLDKKWGFRISQIMVPFKTHADIKEVRDDPQVSRRKYFNECLGLPYDEGEIVLTERHLILAAQAGDGKAMWTPAQGKQLADKGVPLFMGVDYGTGETDTSSFTVVSIGFMNSQDKYQIIYLEKFTGVRTNLAKQPGIIHALAYAFGVRWIGADWGFGAALNQRLTDDYGWARMDNPNILMEFQYTRQKKPATWNKQSKRYYIDRNKSMEKFIDSVRTIDTVFFRFEDLKPFVQDFTTIYIDYNETLQTIKYDHQLPDDAFHSTNYGYMACMQYFGKLVRTVLPDVASTEEEYTAY